MLSSLGEKEGQRGEECSSSLGEPEGQRGEECLLPMCERQRGEECLLLLCVRGGPCWEESLLPYVRGGIMLGREPPSLCTWWYMLGIHPWVYASPTSSRVHRQLHPARLRTPRTAAVGRVYRARACTCKTDYWARGTYRRCCSRC